MDTLVVRLLCIALGLSLLTDAVAGTPTSEDALLTGLLSGYSKDARPPPSNQSTDVHIALFLLSIDDVEERLLTITVAAYIVATWTDRRLAWNASAQSGLDRLVMSASSIWKPDFALTDAVGDVYDGIFFSDFYGVTVTSDGNVTWTMQGTFALRCDFNLTYYPFDIQTCDFRYESLNYPSYLLRLYTETTKIDLSQYHENAEFVLVSTAAITEESVPAVDGNYSDVIFTMTLKRRPLYFVLNLVLPCALLSVLTCFVYLLPAVSGERVGLAITLLLGFAVFQLQVAGLLPMNSLTSTLLTDFILTSMIFNGIALMATIFSLRVAQKADQTVPPWLEKLCIHKLGVFYGITSSNKISADAEDCLSDHLQLKTEFEDFPSGRSSKDTTIKDGRLRKIVSSVRNVEAILTAQEQQSHQEDKWRIVSKVFDTTMFLLFSVAVVWQCIGALILLPVNSS